MPGNIVIEVELDLSDPGLMGRLAGMQVRVDELMRGAVDDILLATEGEARGRAGFKTGNLRRNIMRDTARSDRAGSIEGTVGVARTAPYGVWHHEGTGVHAGRPPIKAKTGSLVFRVGPATLFRKSVKGQRANPFMRDAFDAVNSGFVEQRLRRLAEDVGNLR